MNKIIYDKIYSESEHLQSLLEEYITEENKYDLIRKALKTAYNNIRPSINMRYGKYIKVLLKLCDYYYVYKYKPSYMVKYMYLLTYFSYKNSNDVIDFIVNEQIMYRCRYYDLLRDINVINYAIEKYHYDVYHNAEHDMEKIKNLHISFFGNLSIMVDPLNYILGINDLYYEKLVYYKFDKNSDNMHLFTNLHAVSISRQHINDLSHLNKLKYLFICNCTITQAALDSINVDTLEYLEIQFCRGEILNLNRFINLKRLLISNVKPSEIRFIIDYSKFTKLEYIKMNYLTSEHKQLLRDMNVKKILTRDYFYDDGFTETNGDERNEYERFLVKQDENDEYIIMDEREYLDIPIYPEFWYDVVVGNY